MSDLEYEGQQINQQRQTLTNKMNEVYNAAMDMEVPTAPSKIDYHVEAYTGKCGSSVVEVEKTGTGYSATMQAGGYTTRPRSGEAYVVSESEPKLEYSSEKSETDNLKISNETSLADVRKALASGNYIIVDTNSNQEVSAEIACPDGKFDSEKYDIIGFTPATVGQQEAKTIDFYRQDGQTFLNALDGLKNSVKNFNETDWRVIKDGNSYSFIKVGDLQNAKQNEAVNGRIAEYDEKAFIPVRVTHWEQNEKTGALDSVTVAYTENGKEIETTIDLRASVNAYDETAFEEAMKEYDAKKIEYDKAQNDFNHQTSIYQRQDKQLELKLTRLDNERNALKTEVDALKKVIQDASEKGFKTFSG
jgi:vacuolar-type H+-ATPase subunit I/STV1